MSTRRYVLTLSEEQIAFMRDLLANHEVTPVTVMSISPLVPTELCDLTDQVEYHHKNIHGPGIPGNTQVKPLTPGGVGTRYVDRAGWVVQRLHRDRAGSEPL